jgi:hypothetical protein
MAVEWRIGLPIQVACLSGNIRKGTPLAFKISLFSVVSTIIYKALVVANFSSCRAEIEDFSILVRPREVLVPPDIQVKHTNPNKEDTAGKRGIWMKFFKKS